MSNKTPAQTVSPAELAKIVESKAAEQTATETPVEATPEVKEAVAETPAPVAEETPAAEPEKIETPTTQKTETPKPGVVKPEATQAKTVTSSEKMIISMIENYEELRKTKALTDISEVRASLHRIIRYAVDQQDRTEVLERFLTFIADMGTSRPTLDTVLIGVNQFSRSVRDRISVAYMLVYELLSDRKPKIDYEYCKKVLGGDHFVRFIQARMRK